MHPIAIGRRLLVLFVLCVLTGTLAACGSRAVPALPPSAMYALDGSLAYADGKPVAWAGVALEGTPLGGVTNSEGRFGIQTVRPGSYRLVVVYAGFRSQEVRVRVPGDDAIEHTLDMKKAPRSGVAVADSLPPFNLSLSVRGAN